MKNFKKKKQKKRLWQEEADRKVQKEVTERKFRQQEC